MTIHLDDNNKMLFLSFWLTMARVIQCFCLLVSFSIRKTFGLPLCGCQRLYVYTIYVRLCFGIFVGHTHAHRYTHAYDRWLCMCARQYWLVVGCTAVKVLCMQSACMWFRLHRMSLLCQIERKPTFCYSIQITTKHFRMTIFDMLCSCHGENLDIGSITKMHNPFRLEFVCYSSNIKKC